MPINRRQLFRDILVGAAGSAVFEGVLRGANPQTWQTLVRLFPNNADSFQQRFQAENLKAARPLFGDRGDVVKLAGGRAHYQYPHTMHPDDRWACDSILKYAEQLADESQFDPNAEFSSSSGSFVCTGSPVSNAWSRSFMEYAYFDNAKPALGLTRLDHPVLDLPFVFELNSTVIRRVAKQRRYQSEVGYDVSNWSIRTRSGHLLSPNTASKAEDFLLISRLPNWKEGRAPHKDFQNTVTIFSGTHGVGTAATRLLLEDTELLKNVLLKTEQFEFWQILLTIDRVELAEHPHSDKKRLLARSINPHFECEPINV